MVSQHEELSLKGYTRLLEILEQGGGTFDLSLLYEVSPQLRDVLEYIVDQCVSSFPDHQYIGPDGTMLRVQNWDEKRLVSIRSENGVLTLPRFVLEQVSLGRRWDRVEDIETKADALIVALKMYRRIDEWTTGAEDIELARKCQQLQQFLTSYMTETKLGDLLTRLDAHKEAHNG